MGRLAKCEGHKSHCLPVVGSFENQFHTPKRATHWFLVRPKHTTNSSPLLRSGKCGQTVIAISLQADGFDSSSTCKTAVALGLRLDRTRTVRCEHGGRQSGHRGGEHGAMARISGNESGGRSDRRFPIHCRQHGTPQRNRIFIAKLRLKVAQGFQTLTREGVPRSQATILRHCRHYERILFKRAGCVSSTFFNADSLCSAGCAVFRSRKGIGSPLLRNELNYESSIGD